MLWPPELGRLWEGRITLLVPTGPFHILMTCTNYQWLTYLLPTGPHWCAAAQSNFQADDDGSIPFTRSSLQAENTLDFGPSSLAKARRIMHDIAAAGPYMVRRIRFTEECSSMARAPVSKTGGCRFEVLPLLPIKSITSRQASENKSGLGPNRWTHTIFQLPKIAFEILPMMLAAPRVKMPGVFCWPNVRMRTALSWSDSFGFAVCSSRVLVAAPLAR